MYYKVLIHYLQSIINISNSLFVNNDSLINSTFTIYYWWLLCCISVYCTVFEVHYMILHK